MKTNLATAVLLLASLICTAQSVITDSKGNGTFNYYDIERFRLDLSPEDFSATFAVPGEILYKKDTVDNVKKTRGLVMQVGVTNLDNVVNMSDIKNLKPGFKFKLGYQTNVSMINDYEGPTYSFGIYAVYSRANFTHYNPESEQIASQKPATYGGEVNGTWFPFTVKKERFFLLHANLSFLKTWNEDELANFKSLDGGILQNNGSIIAFKDFDGKYGLLKKDIDKFRSAFSLPLYFGEYEFVKSNWFFGLAKYLMITPYGVVSATSVSKPSYIAGGTLSILKLKKEENSKKTVPMSFSSLEVPSLISVGLDWGNKDGNWSKANVFIKGSIYMD